MTLPPSTNTPDRRECGQDRPVRLRLYDVILRFGSEEIVCTRSAISASAARMDVWRGDGFDGFTFRDFLRIAKVRPRSAPLHDDGYDYVRKNYGVDVRVGARVALRHEGADLEGRQGEIAYPGASSTSRVHVVLDGEKHISFVHPRSIVLLPTASTEVLPGSTEVVA